MSKLTIGDKAPNFKTTNQRGESVSLADFEGTKLIVYFYPKDNTPGCTKQACNLRDNYEILQEKGFKLLGVSPDDEKSHQKFIDKFDLPFDLLIDSDNQVAEAFGVWVEKNMYGRKYMGIARTTFVVDEKGVISDIISKVKTDNHTEQLLK